ncbi:MAG TPA: ammonium transporter [Holophagaceae bacterium]|nr:ammonium transporter [Holophagaceae bacterium]
MNVNGGDTAWVLVSCALVILMLPALALFYGGLVRGKNLLNTWMMSLAMLGLVGVQWVLFGYGTTFGPGGSLWGSLSWAGLRSVGLTPHAGYGDTIPHLLFAAFQGIFALLTIALVSGAVVERMRFRAWLVFALLWTTFIYDPLARWVWAEGGWLRNLGALDFAGGLVVHVSAGTSALVAAAFLGPRREGTMPHSVPMSLLGGGLVAVGWCGFNAGSALAANGVAALALVNTFAGGAAGMLLWMLLELALAGEATALGAVTGLVIGLVAVTPAAGYVTPLAALAIGCLGGCASFGALRLRLRTKVDDALDVFACHGVAGIVGALLTGVFATTALNPGGADGLLAGRPALVGIQGLSILVALGFSALGTAGLLGLMSLVMPLRVELGEEMAGLDQTEHGQLAYPGGGGEGGFTPLAEGVLLPLEEYAVPRDPLGRPLV